MLGFSPIADTPVAAISENAFVFVGSQTLTITLSSAALSAAVNTTVDSQSLITTLNSPTIQAAANYALQSQNLATTLNSVSVVSVNTISVTGLALNISVQGSGAALGGDNAAIAALPLCAIPYPDPVITYTAVRIDEFPAVTGQTLNLSVNDVAVFDDDNIHVGSQVLSPGLNSVAVANDVILPAVASQTLSLSLNNIVAEVQPPVFDSQSITLTQNGVTFSTGATYTAPSQELNLTINSVGIGQLINLPSQTATVTVHSVSVVTDQSLIVGSQSLLFTLKRVSLITDQTVSVGSQTIYTEINGLRLWQSIDTQQTQSCNGWAPGTWETIQFGDLIYGDNFAIGATPVASIEECEPIRKTPPNPWEQVDSTTTTTWSTIQT